MHHGSLRQAVRVCVCECVCACVQWGGGQKAPAHLVLIVAPPFSLCLESPPLSLSLSLILLLPFHPLILPSHFFALHLRPLSFLVFLPGSEF